MHESCKELHGFLKDVDEIQLQISTFRETKEIAVLLITGGLFEGSLRNGRIPPGILGFLKELKDSLRNLKIP